MSMRLPAPRLPDGGTEPENEVRLSFLDHLRELRTRLLHSIYGVAAAMAVVGWFAPTIRRRILTPVISSLHALHDPDPTIKYVNLIEPMMVSFKIAIYGGIFVAAPWILWQIWLFVAPGLYKREKKVVFPFLFFGTLLFYVGAVFCYFVVMPQAFPAMLAFADDPMLRPMLTLDEAYGLIMAMLLGFGVVFELPVVIAFLSMVGLVSAKFLSKYRRHAIVVNVALAAIITPTGDPINLAIMAVPMILFYEVGIVLARILGKKPAEAAP